MGAYSSAVRRESTVDDHELSALDALRAFAAIGVLLAHASVPLLFNGTVITWTRAGDVGVSVFFVLSGFLIASSVLRQPRFDTRGYMIRRAARILPLYYVSMLIALVLVDPSPTLTGAGRADVVTHVFMLHGLSRGMRYSMNGVWWTLTVEWLFYLFMGIVSPLFRRGRYGWFLAIGMIALGVLWRLAVFSGSTTAADSAYFVQQLPGMADLFGVGMLLALVSHSGMLRMLASAWARGSLLVLSFSFVIVMLVSYNSNKPDYWENGAMVVVWPLAFAVGIAGLVAGFSIPGTRFHALSRVSGLAYLGTISYGIYLFHPFVIEAFGDAWFTEGRAVSAVPFILAVLTGTVLLSMLFHYGVERPAMVWGRRMARPSPGLRNPDPAGLDRLVDGAPDYSHGRLTTKS